MKVLALYLLFSIIILVSAKPQADVCGEIAALIPAGCNITVCNPTVTINIVCPTTLFDLSLVIETDLHLCAQPVNVNLSVAVPADDFSYSTEIDGSITIAIPGLSVDVIVAGTHFPFFKHGKLIFSF